MNREFILHIGFREITDLISSAKNFIFLSLPNIHDEVCESLISYKNENNINDIKILLDNSESNYRNGFGDIKAVEKLKKANIDIYELKENLVSFIICDDIGYYLFPQSRIFSSDTDLSSNAVLIDPVSVIRLKNYFSPNSLNVEKDEIENQIIESFTKVKEYILNAANDLEQKKAFQINTLDEADIEEVRNSLDKNPPLHPDLQRQIKTYITKVQFVELTFEGANLHTKDVIIPPKALPFKDENIKKKLNTKMKLFSNIDEKKGFERFTELKAKIEKIRNNYLQPLTCRKDKSVIKIEDKLNLKGEIEKIKKEIPEVNKQIRDFIKMEVLNSKKQIQKELHDFLIENPPDNLKDYKDNLFKESIEDEVNKIINHIKFPEPDQILNKVSIKNNFYDLTFEDFKDPELLSEFSDKGIMNSNDIESIVKIKNAFEVKK